MFADAFRYSFVITAAIDTMISKAMPTPLSVSCALGLNCAVTNHGPIDNTRPARKNTKSNIKSPFLRAMPSIFVRECGRAVGEDVIHAFLRAVGHEFYFS